jgi:hypothetical protein
MTKEEKAFFFAFIPACAEMSFLGSNKKNSLNSVKKIFLQIGRYRYKKMGQFTIVTSSKQKLLPKNLIF